MSIPSIITRHMLEADSDLDLTYKENLMIGQEPTGPHNVTTIFDTPDAGSQLTNEKNEEDNKKDRYEYAGVQIRVRNVAYDKAMQLAKDISSTLHGRGNETVNGYEVKLVRALDNPFLLDWDDNNRARVVVNFEFQHIVAVT